MQSPAMIIITNHLLELEAEAAANRLAKQAKAARPESRRRFAEALNAFRSLLSVSDSPIGLPKLSEYPYRS
ncbi:MAG TPA: hypothetical protein VKB00_02905 [Candidatus Limnocylindrales bacterium]|nr:hypothetical protein [Candidatus Limnocylindrales bacterium]